MNFLGITEKILNITPSICSLTNKQDIRWVNPSNFWRFCETKRSLLTLLIRCGMAFNSNYEEALFSKRAAQKTRVAIERFLFGFTKYIPHYYDKPGWKNTFQNKNEDQVKKRLVRPEPRYEMVSYGTLWGN
jgi:hypothetical protein